MDKETNKLFKIVVYPESGSVKVYDENDKIVISRTGFTKNQVSKIEKKLSNMIKI